LFRHSSSSCFPRRLYQRERVPPEFWTNPETIRDTSISTRSSNAFWYFN
jgi:hypothetical protein